MFPSASEDMFYAKLLELKAQFPEELGSVVEYEWAQRRMTNASRESRSQVLEPAK